MLPDEPYKAPVSVRLIDQGIVYSQILVPPMAEYRLSHHALLNKTHPLETMDHGLVSG